MEGVEDLSVEVPQYDHDLVQSVHDYLMIMLTLLRINQQSTINKDGEENKMVSI